MGKWIVTVPLVGSMTYYGVEADNERAAIDRVMADARPSIDFRHGGENDIGDEMACGELEWLEHVTQGNVCYAPVFDANAEPDDSDDDDA